MKIAKSERGIYEPVQSEEDVLGAIRMLLEFNGATVDRIVERIPWGRKTSEPGIPDLIVRWPKGHSFFGYGVARCCPTICFIEVKRKGGKLRPAQAAWICKALRDGVIAFKADSIEEMVEQFKNHGIPIKGMQ